MISLAVWLAALLPASQAFVLPPSAADPLATLLQKNRVGATAAAAASHPEQYSFDETKAVQSRLENLEREAPDVLTAFYEPHLKSVRSLFCRLVFVGLKTHSPHNLTLWLAGLSPVTFRSLSRSFFDKARQRRAHFGDQHMFCFARHFLHGRLIFQYGRFQYGATSRRV